MTETETEIAETPDEARQLLDAMIRRRLAYRHELASVAVSAGAPRAAEVVAEVEAGRRPWWPELAPLTPAERLAVYRAISAGSAGRSSDAD